MNEKVRINELTHAVRIKYEGSIDQQRVPFNLRKEAKDGLVDWYADRLSLMFLFRQQVIQHHGFILRGVP